MTCANLCVVVYRISKFELLPEVVRLVDKDIKARKIGKTTRDKDNIFCTKVVVEAASTSLVFIRI